MPIPYVQECNESMSYVYSAKGAIVSALERVQGLATDETWQGTPADTWMTDLDGHIRDALSSLGDPLDTAVEECRAHARQLQAESAQAAAAASSGGG